MIWLVTLWLACLWVFLDAIERAPLID